jgi:NAD-dependent SIR2 family protein deacetylase
MIDGGAALQAFLEGHRRLFVLTGAGCSTPSGIPAYRDRDGQWTHRRPMSFAEFVGSPAARRRYWEGSLRGWPRVRDARPNAAHAALARLEAQGRVCGLVTQNVDGLHRRAGSRRLVELHGRLDHAECLSCGARVLREDLQTLLLAWNASANPGGSFEDAAGPRPDGDAAVRDLTRDLRVPDCGECGGVLKPAVVFFGESVPKARVAEAFAALDQADGVLVVGSSLMVYSAYRFVRAALAKGLEVAALTLGRTRADAELTLKIEQDCARALQSVVQECPAAHPS